MEKQNKYRVVVSEQAKQMLVFHAAFLAQVSPPAPCGWYPVGKQEVHEYEAPGGSTRGRLHCRLTSLMPDPANYFAKNP